MKIFLLMISAIGTMINPLLAIDFPEIKGWEPISEVISYNPDNLYEYIDGAADQFLDYGFRLLHSGDLSQGELKITVDIYDMGAPLNAFGVYKMERPEDATGVKLGAEAIISPPYQCLLLKDIFYVKVNVYEGEISDTTGKKLLKAIADGLPGNAGFPESLKLLPQKGMIPESEGFMRIGFLGLSELNNCIHAAYIDDSKREFQMFVILPLEETTNETIWDTLSQKWKKSDAMKHPVYSKKIPYKGVTGVMQIDGKIVGVTDCADEAEMVKRLEAAIVR